MSIAAKNRQLFKKTNAQAVLLKTNNFIQDSNVRYFTGLGQNFLSSNVLILKPGKQPLLLKSLLEPKIRVPGLRSKNIDKRKQFSQTIKKELKGLKRIGINRPVYTTRSLRELKKLAGKKKVLDISKELGSIRATKSEDEIACLKKSARIAEETAHEIPALFRKGVTEKKLGMKIETRLREKGDNWLPFPIIVASDKNSAFPHNVLTGKKITKGLLLLDFGVYHKGYCSDITRVFSVGKPTKKQRRLYASVFAAKQFAQSMIRPGISFGKVFDQADSFLKKETGMKLIHGLGHGLGIDAHDYPKGFLQGNREKIQKNQVLTVEPGIYGKFGGIRIEDDVLVTESGCKPLTRAQPELTRL